MSTSASTLRLLSALARRLNRGGGRLPGLLAFTDPARLPDPAAAIARLPRGAGVIYRHFGKADRVAEALRLTRLCRRRGLVLLIGADPKLAARVGADGVHWPERTLARRLPAKRRFWLYTGAAHGPAGLRRAAALNLDAAVLSPVFPSASPSAGKALGRRRAAGLAARANLPVYALGGVNARTAARLAGSRFIGLAGIGFVA